MFPSDRMVQLHPQAPGSLSVALYDLQGYGGGILTHLLTGNYFTSTTTTTTTTTTTNNNNNNNNN
jgi:hypothetical protein